MTVEDARKFIGRMKTDNAFFDSIMNAEPGIRRDLVTAAGLNFTKDELSEVILEVSDEDLKTVSGGANTAPAKSEAGPIILNNPGDLRGFATLFN